MAPQQKALIAAGVAGGLLLFFGPAFLRWSELRARRDQLQTEVASLQRENLRLYEETRRLREDLPYAEAVARHDLGLVRPGEKMVKFEQAEKPEARR